MQVRWRRVWRRDLPADLAFWFVAELIYGFPAAATRADPALREHRPDLV